MQREREIEGGARADTQPPQQARSSAAAAAAKIMICILHFAFGFRFDVRYAIAP